MVGAVRSDADDSPLLELSVAVGFTEVRCLNLAAAMRS